MFSGGNRLGQPGRPPGQQKSENVGKVVPGIGDEREGMRDESKHDLRDDQGQIQDYANGKGAIEILGRVAMAVSM